MGWSPKLGTSLPESGCHRTHPALQAGVRCRLTVGGEREGRSLREGRGKGVSLGAGGSAEPSTPATPAPAHSRPVALASVRTRLRGHQHCPRPSRSARARSAAAHAGPRQEEDPGGPSGVSTRATPNTPRAGGRPPGHSVLQSVDGRGRSARATPGWIGTRGPRAPLGPAAWAPRRSRPSGPDPPAGSDQTTRCGQCRLGGAGLVVRWPLRLGDHRRGGEGPAV